MGCTVKKGLLRLNLLCSEKKVQSELSRQTKEKHKYRPSKLDILSLWLERNCARAVGQNPVTIIIPCYRVVWYNGGIGGFGGSLHRKRFLLTLEGILPSFLDGSEKGINLRYYF
jgi:O-6-methylguanine DNA methyltransferase